MRGEENGESLMGKKDAEIPNNAIEYTNASKTLFVGPCIVKCVMLAGDGANADCQVYDGVTYTETQRSHIEALSGTTHNFEPPGGVLFRKGLYIAVNANTSKVTAVFEPVDPKKV